MDVPSGREIRTYMRRLADVVQAASPPALASRIDTLGRRRFVSHSMFGEDAVVHGFLQRIRFHGRSTRSLSYVDVGAWRPIQGSNTYWLYRLGGSGTLVEPNAQMARVLRSTRPRDTVLEVACGSSDEVDFYSFGPYAESNTTSLEFAQVVEATQGRKVTEVRTVACMSLERIVRDHTLKHGKPFLLSVDTEGTSTEVLRQVDWLGGIARPDFIITELDDPLEWDVSSSSQASIREFAREALYEVLAVCGVSIVLVDAGLIRGVNSLMCDPPAVWSPETGCP